MSLETAKAAALAHFRQHRIWPSPEYLVMQSGVTQDEARALLLKFRGVQASMPSQAPVQVDLKKATPVRKVPIWFIRWSFIGASFLAIPRTFEFIREWLWQFDKNWLSVVTALLFTVVLFLAPQVFMTMKGFGRWLFFTFSIFLMVFSILATVSGLYQSRTVQADQGIESAGLVVDELKEKRDRDKKLFSDLEKDLAVLKSEKLDPEKWQYWQNKKDVAKKEGELEKVRERLEKSENDFIEKKVKSSERKDFLGETGLEWMMLIIFSILLDLIGPVALGVALFLKDER